jgi:hypothetical protein
MTKTAIKQGTNFGNVEHGGFLKGCDIMDVNTKNSGSEPLALRKKGELNLIN